MTTTKGRAAALKAWKTRRANALAAKRKLAGVKSWETRRAGKSDSAEQGLYDRLKRDGFSEWHAREAAGLLRRKAIYRKDVVEFLLAEHQGADFRMLSLPGSRFEVERELLTRLPRETFVRFDCAERDKAFFRHPVVQANYRRFLPGESIGVNENCGFSIGRGATFLCQTSLADLLDDETSLELSAVWLDMMCNVGSSALRDTIGLLQQHLATGINVPVVVTLMLGREQDPAYKQTKAYRNGDTAGARGEQVARIFRQEGIKFTVRRVDHVKSDIPGCHAGMVNVYGIANV